MLRQKQNTIMRNELLLLIVTFGGYIVFGFSESVKGPALPALQTELGISYTQVGLLLSLNSVAYIAASCFAAPLIRALGLKLTSMLSFMLMTVSGMLIFLSSSYPSLAGGYLCMYIGNGVLELALAILGVRVFVRNTTVKRNIAQLASGLSSAAAPVAASLMIGSNGQLLGWRGMYLLILSLAILPLLPALFTKFPSEDVRPTPRVPRKNFMHDPNVLLSAAVLTFAVLTELTVGGWLNNYLQNVFHYSSIAASGILAGFLIVFAASRLILGPLVSKYGNIGSIVTSLSVSGLLIISAVLLGGQGVALFVIAGAGIAPVYPAVMAVLTKRYPESSDGAVNLTVTLMGVGTVFGNLLLGFVVDLFRGAYAGKSTSVNVITASRAFGLQAGCVLIGIFSLLGALFAALLFRFVKKHGQAV